MNRKWTRILTVVLAVVLAVSGGYLLVKQMEYHQSAQTYAEAASVAGLPQRIEAPPALQPVFEPEAPEPEDPTQAPAPEPPQDPYIIALSEVDLPALREVNGDVVGWIAIPETDLSYPILQGSNNTYYLSHTWMGQSNSAGSIFMECMCAPDMSGFNTILYGHRMLNGSMFGILREYRKESFWQEHPSVYIVTEHEVCRYDIFAAYEAGVREIVYRLDITEPEEKQELIQYALERSVLQTGVTPQTEEQIITLSTCTGQGYSTRWVVQAVLRSSVSLGDT